MGNKLIVYGLLFIGAALLIMLMLWAGPTLNKPKYKKYSIIFNIFMIFLLIVILGVYLKVTFF